MGETRGLSGGGPFKLTTPGDARWSRLVPWPVVVPLAAIVVYLLSSAPLSANTVVPAIGIALAGLVACGGAIASFTPGAKAWARRTAIVTSEGITVVRPGLDPFTVGFGAIGRVYTHPETMGLQIPPGVQLVTDFFGIDGRRIPELAVHHSSYRYAYRTTDRNADGPELLLALRDSPLRLDAASEALVDLVHESRSGGLDGVSERTVSLTSGGLMWHALRSAERDARESERTSLVLVRLALLLAHKAVDTARAGAEDHPGNPQYAYLLAHALLSDVGVSANPGPAALAHRAELRAEAREILAGISDDPAFGPHARADLEALARHAG